jgi:hypothetical protein
MRSMNKMSACFLLDSYRAEVARMVQNGYAGKMSRISLHTGENR